MRRANKPVLAAFFFLLAAVVAYLQRGARPEPPVVAPETRVESRRPPSAPRADEGQSTRRSAVRAAFDARRSNVQVRDTGTVERILRDDHKGSRHQRFLVGTDSGVTVLVAHNIDLAPRVETLRTGDRVEFHGEYEWNEKGGVIHWTHHDPQGRHEGGWIRHAGRTYQ